jgi:hypothetical protein
MAGLRVMVAIFAFVFISQPPIRLVPFRGFMKGTDKFPIQKCEIFRKFKEIGGIARRHTSVSRTSDSVD